MSKYIDADKLKKAIEDKGLDCSFALKMERLDTLALIDSLQQDQPKEICSKCIHHGKDDDYCYYPHGGMQSLINENGIYECTGFYEKEQEQSEVDLKKEMDDYFDHIELQEREMIYEDTFHKICEHFYELGKNAK